MNKEKYKDFDPNKAAVPGRIFGLPHSEEDAKIHIIGAPSAITVSGSEGAELGPEGILSGSLQIELFNKAYPEKAWMPGIYMHPINKEIVRNHKEGRKNFEKVLDLIGKKSSPKIKKQIEALTKKVDQACEYMYQIKGGEVSKALAKKKIVGSLGGCHGSMLATIRAHAAKFKSFTILHLDAHHDLRKAYEGVRYSHASIMYNVLEELPQVKQLVSVGIRSYGEDEYEYAKNSKRVTTFYADDIAGSNCNPAWNNIADRIVSRIPTDEVYISFDIDCLEPYLCPSTGTPVSGGFDVWQVKQLIDAVALKKKIIGFDLNEVVPKTSVDELVAAEILYHLCIRTLGSQGAYN